MQTITFTAGIKKFSIKASEGTPQFSIELEGIVGLNKKTQEVVDNMSGAIIVTLTPAQSKLEFGKIPEGIKIETETKKGSPKNRSQLKK